MEYSSDELKMEAHTVASDSLLSSLLESSEGIYNKEVARIQKKHQELVRQVFANIPERTKKHSIRSMRQKKTLSWEEAKKEAIDEAELTRRGSHVVMEAMIRVVQEERDQRDQEIRAYCKVQQEKDKEELVKLAKELNKKEE